MISSALDDSITAVHSEPAHELYLRLNILLEEDSNSMSTLVCQSRHGGEHPTVEESQPPSANKETLQSWNKPRRNSFRVLAVYFSFFVFGLNDGAYGALLPYLETYYTLSYTVVSLIFLSPFVGYTIAALLNTAIHMRFGQHGVAILATCCHTAAYAVISAHSPYPTTVVMYAVAGFGYGLIDGAWNAWTGNLEDTNSVQGFLSSSYSLGATISPIVATSMSGKQHWGWYTFYWLMVSVAVFSRSLCWINHTLTRIDPRRLAAHSYLSSSLVSHFGAKMAPRIGAKLKTNRIVRTVI
jgi:MFS family permease